MSTFRTPVGPQPSRVYWRRRLVVALGLIAVILIIILIVVRPGSGTPGGTPTPQPSTSAPATGGPADPASTSNGVECDISKVSVEGTTDATNYAAGVNPVISFTLKSLMTEPCTLPVGTDVQEYKITSGDELIWSSKDCQTDPVAATTVLTPGVPKAGPPVTWDRTRSSPDTCASPRDPVIAEGASYHLTVVVGGLTSTNDRQFLLY